MSDLRVATISDVAGTGPVGLYMQNAAKSWVNFNGGGTVAVRDSENVSSLTDNNVGRYSVNLTNSMSNGDYSVQTTAKDGGWIGGASATLTLAGVMYVTSVVDSGAYQDGDMMSVTSFGDLA